MAYEIGGRADKYGNRFEFNWTINKIIDIIDEKISYVVIEALGEDEKGVDLWIGYKDGSKEAQQCKGRNSSLEYWRFSDLNAKGIWKHWKRHLDNDLKTHVALVSPLSFTLLEDISIRAKTNNDAKEFYEEQILKSDQKMTSLFKQICNVINIDITSIAGLEKARDFFSRMHIRQVPDSELREENIARINRLFTGNPESIYRVFLDYVLNEDVYGKKIDSKVINTYLENNCIEYRYLAGNKKIWPTIDRLNEEYEQVFKTFSCGYIERNESSECMEEIRRGNSIVLHGNAGIGKSGCTENIINKCKKEGIVHLAIKLDRNIPCGNSESWASNMGLPASISHCIDAITKETAVIILDQLDALRWTQAHSGDALTICFQIIKELKQINKEREKPISIVFVCRTYDLNNDASISNLFHDEDWKKIEISPLTETEVLTVIGERFNNYSSRMKKLLCIPSNLYIFEKLDKSESYENIEATYQLIKEWWKQITIASKRKGLQSERLEDIKNNIVEFCYKKGRLNAPKIMLKIPGDYEEYLVSSGFVVADKSVVSFVHQSILDCFFAEEMLRRYYEQDSVLDIIGDKVFQTPGKRYQTQIFLQQLLEISSKDFVDVGKILIESEEIRYSFKYVFIELLSQVNVYVKEVEDCVLNLFHDDRWCASIINSVVRGSEYYVHLLRDKGCLKALVESEKTKSLAIDLLLSIRSRLDDLDVEFIRKYAIEFNDCNNWATWFYGDIDQDSNSFFELRMEVYARNSRLMNNYFDFRKILQNCEKRTIRLVALMLKNQIKNREETLYKLAEDIIGDDKDIFITDYKFVLNSLLPLFPNVSDDVKYSNWSARYSYKNGLERTCVLLVKKATEQFAKTNPDEFIEYYNFAFDKGNTLYNEIILDGMYFLDEAYSDFILSYISRKSFINAFEDTSSNGNKLLLTKKLVSKFTRSCSDGGLYIFETTITNYCDSKAVDILKDRIDDNRDRKINHEPSVYWSFWGDMQYELIPEICNERVSEKTKQLLSVLKRKYRNFNSRYDYESSIRCCSVISPVSDKKLSAKNWISIITNPRIGEQKSKSQWNFEKGICIESSIEEFVSEFRSYVTDNPGEIISFMCDKNGQEPGKAFVDAFWSGLSMTSNIDQLTEIDLKKIIDRFGYDYDSYRASNIAEAIEKMGSLQDKDYFMKILWDIALNHNNPQLGEQVVVSSSDKDGITVDSIEGNAINCVRGRTIRAISKMLWDDSKLYENYRDNIDAISCDLNPIIRYASLFILWPIYNNDKEWATVRIFKVFESDNRMIGFYDSRRMLCFCYDKYNELIDNLIKQAFNSNDSKLNKVASYSTVELHMIKNAFPNILEIYEKADNNRRKLILEMIIIYFGLSDYKKRAKDLLNRIILIENDVDNDFLWGKLFRDKLVDLELDKDLICNVLKSKIKRRVLSDFVNLVSEQRKLKEYYEVILEVTISALDNRTDMVGYWSVDIELSKLIIALYDVTANSVDGEDKVIAGKCLDVWDKMYEFNVGLARSLTEQMLCV